MQRMKQLARTAVYWPNIDADIVDLCHQCTTCGLHQNKPSKSPIHPWMLPEKPWSRLHLDHAINFLGHNWLVLVDAYTKYPCIHPTSSVSTASTINLLDEDFSHFGYPHTIVTDNATTFTSEEFQTYCKDRGIVHLTGAPYFPATNGAAERLIQTFKQSLHKSSKPPKQALLEFLMQYRRTPTSCNYSPSELLNNRQLRTKIDILLPSPTQLHHHRKSIPKANVHRIHKFKVGDPCYALYFGPRRGRTPRWVPAIVSKCTGNRNLQVRVVPRGPIWRRHLDQLRPRWVSPDDDEPTETPPEFTNPPNVTTSNEEDESSTYSTNEDESTTSTPDESDAPMIQLPEYGQHNLRRSCRTRKPPSRYGWT